MTQAKVSDLACSFCGTTMVPGSRCCKDCGRVYSAADLQQLAARQWANEMRPLKLAVTFSATFIVCLLWLLSIDFS